MINMNRESNVLKMAEKIISDLDVLLFAAPNNRKGITEIQLKEMRSLIQQRIETIKKGDLPPIPLRFNYLAREVIDSWPLGLAVVDQICEFELLYNAL
jgi:hypothetical protein